MGNDWISTLLPLAIIGIVLVFRFRNLSKSRRFKPARLWVAPVLLTALVGVMAATMPPAPLGWAAMLGGLLLGAAVGWKRGHLMHFERDPASGDLMIRQSPAAFLLILGILAAKRLLTAGLGLDPGQSGAGGGMPEGALILTDGLLGFALGMITAMNWTLWQRSRSVPQHSGLEG